ncbi:hypothetical protein ELOC111193_07600 [Elizabethkingia occulta]|jgi:hypothetical protein|uniref:DUF4197 domain-containing protein n=2 Tax=Elizabethkingia TaxID=308865 RepID=A0AAJ3NFK3_9FLAO|nr:MULTISPECIES: hypothetical protein [Elizabethkingia]MDR2231471.1 hypothetical protein [Flavobacteriaceae bacterium]AQX07374.1 hypothetical protein BBD34_01340 [Elizabethkingia ursingii]KUY31656.1 hypothetical protein ATB96_09135 [Elizabethkingia ursingii]MCL1665247.1 hypothetical protein [Elizabethkingia ursingii]MCL1672447.1 hypothetical protein [Elizabethkingia ursingii]
MKKTLFLSIALTIIGVSITQAQSLLDKIDNIANQVNRAANTTEGAAKTGGGILSLFGKKGKSKTAGNQTNILITGGNLAYVKKLNTLIQGIDGVTESQMKFNAEQSAIALLYSGSTEDLLAKIQEKSKDIVKDEYVTGIEQGTLNIKLK